MYDHSDQEIEALRAEALKKCGSAELFSAVFVPDGAEDDEGIVVLWRRFTPIEFGAWIDRPSSVVDTINTAMDVILSIDDKLGRDIPAAVNHLADLMDFALGSVLAGAARPLGFIPAAEVMTATLGRKTTEADLERFGLGADVLALREKYSDPGQLRMVKAAELPGLVVRRPTREEMARALKAKMHAGSVALATSCIVSPAAIEARRELLTATPGLGATLFPVFREMRQSGATLEGKGGRSISPPRVT